MSRRVANLAVVATGASPLGADWREERMRSLVDTVDLGDEWDADRMLVVPHPGGLLCPHELCRADNCESLVDGASVLCRAHRNQMAASGATDLDAWLAIEGARPALHRYLSEQRCAVTGDDGERCGRRAMGAASLCHTHATHWAVKARAGERLESFLAAARPLGSLGPCAVACCYLEAAYVATGLCELHYEAWSRQGRPTGKRFASFCSVASQPANGRVLSLRGLPTLVGLELLYAIGCRRREQVRTKATDMRPYVNRLRAEKVASLTELDPARIDPTGKAGSGRFPRFCFDRVRLAYADPEAERAGDVWDLRVFGRSGRLDFSAIRQDWLREATKSWAAAGLAGVTARSAVSTVQHQVHSVRLLSAVLASGPGGGHDPEALGRPDVERFLARAHSFTTGSTGRPHSKYWVAGLIADCALVLRESREMGLLTAVAPTFAIRRAERGHSLKDRDTGRALPPHIVAVLDAHLNLLAAVPGSAGGPAHRNLGVVGERAGEMAVLTYELLKGTGRRAGEIASLHLDCLDLDETGKAVLIYDNHKAGRLGRRLPLADTTLVGRIRHQQTWVAERFAPTPTASLWLLPRAMKNTDGTAPITAETIAKWMKAWVTAIPSIDAGTSDDQGRPVPFDRKAIHPHAFRHTYAQTLADQGVPAPVLRDLMDHTSLSATLGYFKVGETKKRAAVELLARHTIDNRGTVRPAPSSSSPGRLREELSWVAVPMGKCAEPTNVRAGGGACPIRYQCAACPHFESDPSYLPELVGYADDLRKEREAMLAVGTPPWAVDGVSRQLDAIVGHVRTHQQTLAGLPADQRAEIQHASVTLRKVRQSVPVAFGRRRDGSGRG